MRAGWESLLDPCHLSFPDNRDRAEHWAVWKRGKQVVLICQEKENKEGSKCALAATSYLARVNWVSHLRATMSLAAALPEANLDSTKKGRSIQAKVTCVSVESGKMCDWQCYIRGIAPSRLLIWEQMWVTVFTLLVWFLGESRFWNVVFNFQMLVSETLLPSVAAITYVDCLTLYATHA